MIPSLKLIDQAYLEDAHARGLSVCVYSVYDPEYLRAVVVLRVYGVSTIYPERVLKHLLKQMITRCWTKCRPPVAAMISC